MKHTLKYLLILLFAISINSFAAENDYPDWVKDIGAQTVPDTGMVILVNDFGAVNNGLIRATDAIQQAIDKCAAEGGGRVAFKPGVYLTGSIYLKSNVDLHIGENVEIRGVIDLEAYPDIDTRVAGIMMEWPSALINVLDQENVAISGSGTVHAQGRYHWERYWKLRTEYTPLGLRWASDYDCKRVRTILVSDSKNVTVKDLTLKQAGFWTVHVLFSNNVTVSGLEIDNNVDGFGPSTDGIDIDSSSKILVEHCKIDCHDDNICLKAGRDADGIRVNRPTEYILVRNCVSYEGAGCITIGSETSGWIRHVIVENMEGYGTSHLVRLKSALTRGGGLSDLYVSNIVGDKVRTPIAVTLNWNPSYSYASLENEVDSIPEHWTRMLEPVDPEKGIPHFKNVTIRNMVSTNSSSAFLVSGMEDSYLENFTLENISISSEHPGKISYTKDLKMKNISVTASDGKPLIREENINLIEKSTTL